MTHKGKHVHKWIWSGYRRLFICKGYPTCQVVKGVGVVERILDRIERRPKYREATVVDIKSAMDEVNAGFKTFDLFKRIPSRRKP